MDSNIFRRLLGRAKRSDHEDNTTPGATSSQSRILDLQRVETEALLQQTERLLAAYKASTDAVLDRLGIPVQQPSRPSPQPPTPTGPRRGTESSVPGQRIRPVSGLPPLNVEVVNNGWTSRTSPQTPITQPPSAPRPRRRVSHIPILPMDFIGTVKQEADGYGLLTARGKVDAIRETVGRCYPNSIFLLPQPPVAPKRMPMVHLNQPLVAPRRMVHLPQPPTAPIRKPLTVTPVTPVPPPQPTPPQKRESRRGTSLRPAATVSRGKKTAGTRKVRTAGNKKHEELEPMSNPVEGLSLSFKLISSEDWDKKIKGLQTLRALVEHHPDALMDKLHDVCQAVIEEVKNLRSSVACAAMDTVTCLYVHLKKDMDSQAEKTGRALLMKIAQANANAFVQQEANQALEALVQNCSPGRVLNALLNTGQSHMCVAVRASTAKQLRLLVDRLGADEILTAGETFTKRFLIAVSKLSADAAAEVRLHGQAILQELASHKSFMQLWQKIVAEKDRLPLEKILKNVKRRRRGLNPTCTGRHSGAVVGTVAS